MIASLQPAKALWAKASKNDVEWLPLYVHMADSAGTAGLLWDNWLPSGTKDIIVRAIETDTELSRKSAYKMARKIFVFLAAGHDLGKAIPAFQYKPMFFNRALAEEFATRLKTEKLNCKKLVHPDKIPHGLASEGLLEKQGFERACAVVLGGHHGKPPSSGEVEGINAYADNTGFKDEAWNAVQIELFNYALRLAHVEGTEETALLKRLYLDIPAQVILSGLVIMTDWLASDENRFPYITHVVSASSLHNRAIEAWEDMRLHRSAIARDPGKDDMDLYRERFPRIKTLRPIQTAAAMIAAQIKTPGLVIIEAPMGEGKTEAALVMAEIFAQKSGKGGLFFALPTRATSDGIFPRIKDWVSKIAHATGESHSLSLAHAKARLNEEFRGLKSSLQAVNDGGEDNVIAHEWFTGRKKGLLADFVVGTIDQVLMAGLRQKHQAMRHLALANKVVIVDECHAYDAYMSQYLYKTLKWLGVYRIPVIILSATLPAEKRQELVNAYRNEQAGKKVSVPWKNVPAPPQMEKPKWAQNKTYPLITYTDSGEVKQKSVESSNRSLPVSLIWLYEKTKRTEKTPITEQELPIIGEITTRLDEYLIDGGCAGIIVNTVRRAQNIAKALAEHYGANTVRLLHSRFISADRVSKEMEIRELLGAHTKNRPAKLIVVGTQVMEQSLDVDFDLLFTDICPMDLFIQRLGRLHRHDRHRQRPEKLQKAVCFIMGTTETEFDKGAEKIYGKYLLLNTRQLLSTKSVLNLPADIPELVQTAYAPTGVEMPPAMEEEYAVAKRRQEEKIAEKENRANIFQISQPNRGKRGTLVNWLNLDAGEDSARLADAVVRDTEPSLEVIVIQKRTQKYQEASFHILPWVKELGGNRVPCDYPPDDNTAATLSACTVNLPGALSYQRIIGRVIDALEKNNMNEGIGNWQESPWLKGELFLILDENFTATLCGYTLKYDEKYGLFAKM